MNRIERKITKIGNSYGITIPNDLLKKAGLQHGDNVQLEYVNDEIKITRSRKVSLPEGISEDFFETVQETMVEYDSTIKGLVDR
ncbi:MAG: AbrB/MazE/SpoVT family DNA-binding domain-containing protein [Atopostipes suicloacalis]|uniref:AbrB/MazE/SpoVT family DNA-binding domain-containing protein n=1 Tax=Alkalibacterium sp. TaxID=1872447 RepID=UPI0026475CEA|nr:AbrB/MazE/SpoVT family DNA-binding domain-containing protein [Alkalibacterium sp.]MDN6294702.1 AbrB/MazE/SpoVT family DNA-binding domain-containing protein [Alkalibacterium sp.]MDN6296352.1 AbrB/MazE/SpoVT family DNA-binding domain-containing protein [Alkalibacterium sp.]MDN6398760.1 AbrB/MazE/SpoVT family DNA-binding domain-containing protein [Alkalibacterium sp.]MDN6731082.1 AbrB/MazE/SpoVT family DNA-binding domain-containing protein [Atopostipes suicloacalis]